MRKVILSLLSLSLVAGCSTAHKTKGYVKKQVNYVQNQVKQVRDHQQDYLVAGNKDIDLKLPADLNATQIQHDRDVPAVKKPVDSVIQPPGSLVGLQEYRRKHGVLGRAKLQKPLAINMVHIQQKADVLEMVLDSTTQQAWAQVATALKLQEFNVYGGNEKEQRFFVLDDAKVYQLQLTGLDAKRTRIRVLNREGKPEKNSWSKNVLDRLSLGLTGHKKTEGIWAWATGVARG